MEPCVGNRRASDTSGEPLPRAVCSLGLSTGTAAMALAASPHPLPQSICSPLLPSLPSLLLSTWLWVSRVSFLPALVPELGTHSASVKMRWQSGTERAGLLRGDPAVGSLGRLVTIHRHWGWDRVLPALG